MPQVNKNICNICGTSYIRLNPTSAICKHCQEMWLSLPMAEDEQAILDKAIIVSAKEEEYHLDDMEGDML